MCWWAASKHGSRLGAESGRALLEMETFRVQALEEDFMAATMVIDIAKAFKMVLLHAV